MKAVLDHVGIAVSDIAVALEIYCGALGLEVEATEDVASQRVRAHFIVPPSSRDDEGRRPVVKLEILEATALDSPIARSIARRGPGLHHIALRVENIQEALSELRARGIRLIDEEPRPGAEGALVAFLHPSSTHGVLIELKQPAQP
jgi:methylmalonyl-CoA/ethylmalonyl-CoA epimerase